MGDDGAGAVGAFDEGDPRAGDELAAALDHLGSIEAGREQRGENESVGTHGVLLWFFDERALAHIFTSGGGSGAGTRFLMAGSVRRYAKMSFSSSSVKFLYMGMGIGGSTGRPRPR